MNIEKNEQLKTTESEIDLSNLKIGFWDDRRINDWHENNQLPDFEQWHKENIEVIKQASDEIKKAIEMGLVSDDSPQALYDFQVERMHKSKDKVLEVRDNIKENVDSILNTTSGRLANYLPDWQLEGSQAVFKINPEADFRVEKRNISVDLQRLTFQEDPIKETQDGLTHELFHVWLEEKGIDNEDYSGKTKILFGCLNEGLAVLISELSLKEHHEKQSRNYNEYVQESFEFFNRFLKLDEVKDRKKIEKTTEAFKNMGEFYVVGYEICDTILKEKGIEFLRELIKNFPQDYSPFFEEYKKISQDHDGLNKIGF